MVTPSAHLVVVGASAAGTATARAVRAAGWDGSITVVGEEAEAPYDRPPLSKQVLTGAWDADRIRLHGPDHLHAEGIHLVLGQRATAADMDRRTVTLEDGSTLSWSHLVIATGVSPRRLPSIPVSHNVHQLRTLNDALTLRSNLRAGARILIVGAGFIGLEVAAAAQGVVGEVTVVERSNLPLADRLGSIIGQRVRKLHEQAGVRFHLGEIVTSVEREGDRVTHVQLSSGRRLAVDVIVVGVGSQPSVGWLPDDDFDLSDGVACDTRMRAAPGVWAAGDVANVLNPRTGQGQRFEHRFGANDHAQIIAADIMGHPHPAPRPSFMWTDQYDTKIQVVGRPSAHVTADFVQGDPEAESFVCAWTTEGRLSGLVAWNAPRQLNAYRRALNDAHTELHHNARKVDHAH